MKMKFDTLGVPLGLIGFSFLLEWMRGWFRYIPSYLVGIVFWCGIGTMGLVVVLRVICWVKNFLVEMRS